MTRARRLFAGAFPPLETAQAVHRAVAERLEAEPVRLVPAEEIHLTLHFLGATDEARIPSLLEALEETLPRLRSPSLRITRTGAFPEAGRARVLWVGLLEDPASRGRLAELGRACREALAGADEVQTPHLTVARPSRGDRLEVPRAFRDLSIDLPWTLDEVRLVESCPGEKGTGRFPSLAAFRLFEDPV